MGLTFSRDGKTAETGTMNLTNLLPENIRQGVNIAGVVGELGVLSENPQIEIVQLYQVRAGEEHLYTVPEGVKYIIATIIGAGGAGGSGGSTEKRGAKGGDGEYSWFLNDTNYAMGGYGGSGGSAGGTSTSSIGGAGSSGGSGYRLDIFIKVNAGQKITYYLGRGGLSSGGTYANSSTNLQPNNYPRKANGINKSKSYVNLDFSVVYPSNTLHVNDCSIMVCNRGGKGGVGYITDGEPGERGHSKGYGSYPYVGGAGGAGGRGGGFGGGGAGSHPLRTGTNDYGDPIYSDVGGNGGNGGKGAIELILIR